VIALKFLFKEIAKPKIAMQDVKVFKNQELQERLVKDF